MELNKGIKRLILLLSILVGTTIVVMTAQSDYTLGGSFHSGAEIVLGHMFLWAVGFSGVWVIYGAAIFLVKGFDNIKVSDAEEVEVSYHPLPEKKVQKVQTPPVILSWKEQIDRVRRASSRQRIRLIDTKSQTKTETRPAGNTISGDMIRFHCRFCSQKIIVPKIHAGKRGQCLKCKKILLIPGGKPKVAIGTGMSAVSQVIARARRRAESRKAAWNSIQAELAAGNRVTDEKKEVKAEVKAGVQPEAAEAVAPAAKEKVRETDISAQAKDVASVIAQVKAEARAKAMELTGALEKLKVEMEEKIRAQATAAAEIVVAEARAHAEPAAKPKAKITKPKTKAKAKAKPKTIAEARAHAEPATKPKGKITKPKAKITKPKTKARAKAKPKTTVKAKITPPKAKVRQTETAKA